MPVDHESQSASAHAESPGSAGSSSGWPGAARVTTPCTPPDGSGRVSGCSGRRSFGFLLAGGGITHAGSCVHRVALPALAVLHLGASPGQVSVLAFAATLPALVVSLPAGVLVDRYPLRSVLIATDLAAATVVLSMSTAAALDILTLQPLYAIALTLGAFGVVHQAASSAAVPALAAPERLHQASSQYTAVITTGGISGTALGTLLVAVAGPARTLIGDVVCRLLSACCAARVRDLSAPSRNRAERRPMLAEIGEGLRFCVKDPVLRPLFMALTMMSIGLGLTTTLLAYHLLTTVRTGTTGLGVIMAVGSLGGLIGALTAPRLVGRWGSGPVLVVSFTLYGLMQIPPLLAAPGPVWVVVLALASCGQSAAATCAGTTQRTVQQWHTPVQLRARVQQTSLWLCNGSAPFAALAAGALVGLTGVRIVMVLGVLLLLLSAGVLWGSPVRHLTNKDGATP
ncbi:MFS transporter [Streptomyces rubiginosohelvolus]|uniref:MFS transporter n=1 Tax=Streptomyces rubiginosohelvolus TaxID=67362 RepID=UPI003F4C6D8F